MDILPIGFFSFRSVLSFIICFCLICYSHHTISYHRIFVSITCVFLAKNVFVAENNCSNFVVVVFFLMFRFVWFFGFCFLSYMYKMKYVKKKRFIIKNE